MTIDEFKIALRVTADGVREGMNAAKSAISTGVSGINKEFKKIEEQKKALQEEIKIKMSAPDIVGLQNHIKKLVAEKELLNEEIKLNVHGVALEKMKTELRELRSMEIDIEREMKVTTDDAAAEALIKKFVEINDRKKELGKEIKIGVDAKAVEGLQTQMKLLDADLRKAEREMTIKINSQGLPEAEAKIRGFNAQLKEMSDIRGEATAQFPKLALAATAAFGAIVVGIKNGVDAFNECQAAMNGLKSQLESVGGDFGAAMDVVREKAADGLISESDVAASVKNLTMYGLSIEQASKMIDRLKDSAAYNRQAHYTLGEAVRVTTEGIRMENSTLSDAAGVSKNIAKMIDDYASSIDKTRDSLTEAEKAQAIFNGVMDETKSVIGNAEEYSNGLAGAQARLDASGNKLAQSYGSAMAPAVELFTKVLTAGADMLTEINNTFPGLVSGVTLATAGILAFITVSMGLAKVKVLIDAVKVSMTTMQAAAGPVGLAMAAIGVVAGVVITALNNQKQAQEELNEKKKEYIELTEAETTADNVGVKKEKIKELEDLKKKYQDYIKTYKEMANELDANKDSFNGRSGYMEWYIKQDAGKEAGVNIDELKDKLYQYRIEILNVTDAEGRFVDETAKIDQEIENLTNSVGEFESKMSAGESPTQKAFEQLNDTITKTLSGLSKLDNAFSSITKGNKLSAESIIELCGLYPELRKYIAQTGDATFKNGEVLKQVHEAEKASIIENIQLRQAGYADELSMVNRNVSAMEGELAELECKMKEAYQTHIQYGNIAKKAYEDKKAQMDGEKAKLAELQSYYEMLNAEISAIRGVELKVEVEGLDKLSDAADEIKKKTDGTIDSIMSLASAKEKLAENAKLSAEEIINLSRQFPELKKYLLETGDATFDNGRELDNLTAAMKENLRVWLESERLKAEATIQQGNARLYVISQEISALSRYYVMNEVLIKQLQQEARDITANTEKLRAEIESAMNGLDFGSFESERSSAKNDSKGVQAYKNDALDEYLQELSDKRALDLIDEQKYVDGLIYARERLTQNDEERTRLSIQIYGKQKEIKDKAFNDYLRSIDDECILLDKSNEYKLEKLKEYQKENADILTEEQNRTLTLSIHSLETTEFADGISEFKNGLDDMHKYQGMTYAEMLTESKKFYEENSELMTSEQQREFIDGMYTINKQAVAEFKTGLDDMRKYQGMTYSEMLTEARKYYEENADSMTPEQQREFVDWIHTVNKQAVSEFKSGLDDMRKYQGMTYAEMLKEAENYYNENSAGMTPEQRNEFTKWMLDTDKLAKTEMLSNTKKQYDDEKTMGKISLQEYADRLKEMVKLYEQYGLDTAEITRQQLSAQRTADDNWLSEGFKSIDTVFNKWKEPGGYDAVLGVIERFRERVIDVYRDYPQKLIPILEQLDEYQVTAAENTAAKVVAIKQSETDRVIGQYDRLIDYYKQLNGVTMPDGSIFKFGAADEIKLIEIEIEAVDRELSWYEERLSELTEEEAAEYQKRLELRKSYITRLSNLQIEAVKDEQALINESLDNFIDGEEKKLEAAVEAEKSITDAKKKAANERSKALEEETRAELERIKQAGKHKADAVKSSYDEQIRLAGDYADAEIAIYERKIKEIDELIEAMERRESDEEFADKIKRLQEQLLYERDDANKYELQKEIDNLTSENNKRLTRQNLDDQKAALSEQIKATRDSVSSRKQELQELRDAEVKAAEESTSLEVEKYEKKLEIQKTALSMELEALDSAFSLEKEKLEELNREKVDKARKTSAETVKIAAEGIDDILTGIENSYALFEEAGDEAGKAFNKGFNNALENADEAVEYRAQSEREQQNITDSTKPADAAGNYIGSQAAIPGQEDVKTAETNYAAIKGFMKDLKDTAIQYSNEQSAAEISAILGKTEAVKDANETELADLSGTRDKNIGNLKAVYKKIIDLANENAKTELDIVSRSINAMIQVIKNKVWEYAEAGRLAGLAYTSAFNAVVSEIQNSSAAYTQNTQTQQAQGVTRGAQISVTQSFYTPTVTPSKLAAADAETFERLARYI